MTPFFEALLSVAVLVFPVASMLSVGLTFSLKQIAAPLRFPSRVFRALVANFVLVPLLALGLSRALGLDASLEAGVLLVGAAAGAPFLLKLTQAAGADVSLSAALLVLLMPVTVIYMPLVVPLLIADASVNAMGIAVPLVSTLLVPLAAGLILDSVLPKVAARLQPIARHTSTVALVVLIASTIAVNGPLFRELGVRPVVAVALLTAGAFGLGYLLSGANFDRRAVMGLGAGQRNIAAALVVASQDFDDPRTLVMVVLFSVVDLMVLFPIAWMLRRHAAGEATSPGPRGQLPEARSPS